MYVGIVHQHNACVTILTLAPVQAPHMRILGGRVTHGHPVHTGVAMHTYTEYMVTVDNGLGGRTAAHGISYVNPLYTPSEATRVAAHPRNRELAPVILVRSKRAGERVSEWAPVRVSVDDYGVPVVTPDYAVIDDADVYPVPAPAPRGEDGEIDPLVFPSPYTAPVSARTATRGSEWELELMDAPIPVPASGNAIAGVVAAWIDDASGLHPVQAPTGYYRPYTASDALIRRTPNAL